MVGGRHDWYESDVGAVGLWARVLVRNHWRATVLLGLLCGLGAGAAGAAWATARTTKQAFPEFVASHRGPSVGVYVCPDRFDEECARTPPTAAERNAISSADGVDAAVRVGAVVGRARAVGEDRLALFNVLADRPPDLPDGLLIEGTSALPVDPGDIVVNETAAGHYDLHAGDAVTFTPYLAEQDGAGDGTGTPDGPPLHGRVVGVIRQPNDLAASARAANEDTIYAYAPRAWWAQVATMYRYGLFTLVWTDPGVALLGVRQSVRDAVAPSVASFEAIGGDATPTVDDAIDFEVWAARVFAIVVALAVVLLLGQAVSRQVQRESGEVPTLRAIGLTRRQFGTAAALRWSVTAGVAVATAVVVVVLSSPIAPIGLARRTIASPSISVDALVVFVTVLAIVALMLVFAFAAAWRTARLDRSEPPMPPVRTIPALGPAAATGVRATVLGVRRPLRSNTGSAIVAIALVTMAAVAALAVVASYDALVDHPARFGAPWDAVVGNIGSPADVRQATATLDTVHGVRAAAGILDLDGVHIGQETVPLVAFLPIGQLPTVRPTIVDGRAPRTRGEIALGRVTMDDLGLEPGDHVVLRDPTVGVKVAARVVGRAVVNNTYALEPGNGGVIDAAWARELMSAVGVTPVPQQIAVQVDGGNRAAVLRDLRRAFPESYSPPVPSTSLRNLHRLRGLPWTLVGMLLILALGVTLHALVSAIRHRRPELAVLRALGFTTRATRASVLWQTAALSLVGAMLGTALGLVVGRVGWHALATTNGIDVPTVLPGAGIVLIVVLAVIVPVGLVVAPAVRESHRRVGEVLRVE